MSDTVPFVSGRPVSVHAELFAYPPAPAHVVVDIGLDPLTRERLTPRDARRVAMALLLAADEADAAPPRPTPRADPTFHCAACGHWQCIRLISTGVRTCAKCGAVAPPPPRRIPMPEDFATRIEPATPPTAPVWTPAYQRGFHDFFAALHGAGFHFACLVEIRSHETGEYGHAESIGFHHWTTVLDLAVALAHKALEFARREGQGEAAALEALRQLSRVASNALGARGHHALPAPPPQTTPPIGPGEVHAPGLTVAIPGGPT